MPALYPLTFQPIFKERVWGGRSLARLYGKHLPTGGPIGESWEISDRPGDASVIANGPLAGKDLHWLVENHRYDLLGDARLEGGRFPLLIKLLDAQEKLSLQVHPPAAQAAKPAREFHTAHETTTAGSRRRKEADAGGAMPNPPPYVDGYAGYEVCGLGGDPKTEMWFIAEARPGAELYVGLKPGVTRADFERRIRDGSVAECFHRVPVQAGDTMFLPSGRVHAIGAGLVIFEIQQNSDTTYRVFDWNRVGLDGQPRELHIPQSLASIDFNDFEPALVSGDETNRANCRVRKLISDPLFNVELVRAQSNGVIPLPTSRMQIIGVVAGEVRVSGSSVPVLRAGHFCLLPACLPKVELIASPNTQFLRTEAN